MLVEFPRVLLAMSPTFTYSLISVKCESRAEVGRHPTAARSQTTPAGAGVRWSKENGWTMSPARSSTGPRGGSSAISSPTPASRSSPRATPTTRSIAPRGSGCSPGCCAVRSRRTSSTSRPEFPQLICTCHETIKIVGENPDNHYLGASLDGQYDYRIWGTRGDAKWISFNLFSGGGFGGGGPGTGATLHEEQMHIEPDGTFEVIISQREHPGNWLRSEADTRSLAIRQTFLDKRQPGARRSPHRAHRRGRDLRHR